MCVCSRIAGAEAIFLCLLALGHLGSEAGLADALLGRHGGLAGWGISQFLLLFLPSALVWTVLTMATLAGLVGVYVGLPPTWQAIPGALSNRLRVMLAPAERLAPGEAGAPEAQAPLELLELDEGPHSRSKDLSRRRRPRNAQLVKRPEWLPPLDLLRPDPEGNGPATSNAYSSSARQRAQLIKQTLADFGVPVEVVSIKEGPTVTQFGVEPGEIVRERDGELVRRRGLSPAHLAIAR